MVAEILASDRYLTSMAVFFALGLVFWAVRSLWRWREHHPLSHRKIRKLRADAWIRDPAALSSDGSQPASDAPGGCPADAGARTASSLPGGPGPQHQAGSDSGLDGGSTQCVETPPALTVGRAVSAGPKRSADAMTPDLASAGLPLHTSEGAA